MGSLYSLVNAVNESAKLPPSHLIQRHVTLAHLIPIGRRWGAVGAAVATMAAVNRRRRCSISADGGDIVFTDTATGLGSI